MSNIYIKEPPTFGKILMKTSVGDIDIELWSKETPKACRNFIQLAMEGYFDDTIFHRVVKDFIVQGGDASGTGLGGESIYDNEPFKDEFHSRLRFNRRGLVALANAGKDDNKSQFFFTMAATAELNDKHTIFGKVTGTTIFNMLKLQEGNVDHNERPEYPKRIISIEILKNPFDGIKPREIKKKKQIEEIKIKSKSKATKDFKLLSFGEEAEEDECDLNMAIEKEAKFKNKSKSLPDLIEDKKDESDKSEFKKSKRKMIESKTNEDLDNRQDNNKLDDDALDETEKSIKLNELANKLPNVHKYTINEDDELSNSSEDKYSEEKKKMEKARNEIEQLKKEELKKRAIEKYEEKEKIKKESNPILIEFKKSNEKYANCNYSKTVNREQQVN